MVGATKLRAYTPAHSICRLPRGGELAHDAAMRGLSLFALMALAACGRSQPDAPAAPVPAEVWQAGSRDRLCLKGNRAGFIVYGEGNSNCSARGRAVRSDAQASITPDGDNRCTFIVAVTGDTVTLRAGSGEGCAYYCGPGAAIGDLKLTRAPAATPATDLAGDALC